MGSDDQKLTDCIFASDLLKNMRQMVIDHGLANITR
jgi:phospholipid/cholesterol/gamma-HCH transport system ATP-binding protein